MVTTGSDTWEVLSRHALSLIDDVLQHGTRDLYWIFCGGAVLMLRHHHRFSKGIDIFQPNPLALGFLTPRLSSRAESKSRPRKISKETRRIPTMRRDTGKMHSGTQ